jgi:hypothetical protein
VKRYTAKSLEADLPGLNETLGRLKVGLQFVIGGRNGYTAIDLATPDQAARHCCQRMLVGGTPRECLQACHEFISRHA